METSFQRAGVATDNTQFLSPDTWHCLIEGTWRVLTFELKLECKGLSALIVDYRDEAVL